MRILLLFLFFVPLLSHSKNSINLLKDSVWISPDSYYLSKGKITTLLNQSQYKNWVAGGINNLSLTLILDYDFILKKKDLEWINRVDGAYGLVKNQSQDVKKMRIDLKFILFLLLKIKGDGHIQQFLI